MIEPRPVTLTGTFVALEPLEAGHAAALYEAAPPDIFDHLFNVPAEWSVDGFRGYIEALKARPNTLGFAIVDRRSGRPIGVSCYLSIVPEHSTIEIGTTWIGAGMQGTAVNPESKLLLLENAFETLGAERVQLVSDARNARSRRAIAKLGAKEEGILRSLTLLRDGHRRDTVVFSILKDEWPEVRSGLDRRLAVFEALDEPDQNRP